MKTQFYSTMLSAMVFCGMLLIACGNPKIPQYNVSLQAGDGTTESYTLLAGSMVLVHDGDRHMVVKVNSGNKDEMELQVTSYSYTNDTIKNEHTIQKKDASTHTIRMKKGDLLDPAGTVQVNFQSMLMVDTGTEPKGKCKGNCCEAKCFSMYCCVDPDECKDVPCDCKPPAGCPGTYFALQSQQFLELFLSGKDMMVFKN